MVEYTLSLDSVFGALSDPTRRDILQRLMKNESSVGDIARHYDLTFAAISKHLKVLERANLVAKRRKGKEQMVHTVPGTFASASSYLESYRQLWDERFDSLDALLKEMED